MNTDIIPEKDPFVELRSQKSSPPDQQTFNAGLWAAVLLLIISIILLLLGAPLAIFAIVATVAVAIVTAPDINCSDGSVGPFAFPAYALGFILLLESVQPGLAFR